MKFWDNAVRHDSQEKKIRVKNKLLENISIHNLFSHRYCIIHKDQNNTKIRLCRFVWSTKLCPMISKEQMPLAIKKSSTLEITCFYPLNVLPKV